NKLRDFSVLREELWYRIPVESVEKWLKDDWPPRWLAFYQTKIFGNESYAINYYGKVKGRPKASYGWELIPERSQEDEKGRKQYYQVYIDKLLPLKKPIFSYKWHRVTFIPTTWRKFSKAVEINDLYDGSPLEDRLWAEFKRLQIPVERQKRLTLNGRNYF